MKHKYKVAVLFGASHGINDFIAGYLLAHLSTVSTNYTYISVAFLVYSVLAFGGQLPAGIMVDKYKKVKFFSMFALLCMMASIAVSGFSLLTAIILSAVASAFIHVCGGAACYLSDNKSITLSGIFTSPGVIGLISGGILGSMQFEYFYLFLVPIVLLLLILQKTTLIENNSANVHTENTWLDTHDFVMLFLLFAIALRSLFWNIVHMMCFDNNYWLMALGISAGVGKLIGAVVADRIDWKKYIFISICASVVLLNMDKSNIYLFCAGVFFLQSAVPITLLVLQNYLKDKPATGAGLCLGAAVLIAGLPTYFKEFRIFEQNDYFILLLSMLFFISNLWMIKSFKNKFSNR